MLDKKGFLFTVTIFLILTYILLSISVWVKAVEASERSYSEFYKESTVELTIEQITAEKMDNITNIIMTRSLARLNDHSIDNPVKEDAADPNKYITSALKQLATQGTADSTNFIRGTGIPAVPNDASLNSWAGDLNKSLQAIGLYVSEYSVSGMQINQTAVNIINYSFDIKLSLKDTAGTSAIARTYHISNAVDVTGLVDPALARESKAKTRNESETIYRQFFFNTDDYSTESDVNSNAVQKLSQPATAGQGWLYAPIVVVPQSAEDPENGVLYAGALQPEDRRSYILVGSYNDIINYPNYGGFAGYILTSTPSYPTECTDANGTVFKNEDQTFNAVKYSGDNCTEVSTSGESTDKPFIVAPGFHPADAPVCPVLTNNKTSRCVLFIARALPREVAMNPAKKLGTPKGIYDVEGMRDFIMCGYYTKSTSAPSYLQRLFTDSYTHTDSTYGIETFVIGNYANDYGAYDTSSRLDRELFKPASPAAIKVRGLPGCKDWQTCSDSPVTGIFAVSESVKNLFGLGQITCDDPTYAGCD